MGSCQLRLGSKNCHPAATSISAEEMQHRFPAEGGKESSLILDTEVESFPLLNSILVVMIQRLIDFSSPGFPGSRLEAHFFCLIFRAKIFSWHERDFPEHQSFVLRIPVMVYNFLSDEESSERDYRFCDKELSSKATPWCCPR